MIAFIDPGSEVRGLVSEQADPRIQDEKLKVEGSTSLIKARLINLVWDGGLS